MSTGKGRIPASATKVEIWASAEKVESRQVPKKGRNPGKYQKSGIRASTKEGWIQESTKKVGSGRVPEKGPGEYQERVESGRVPERWNLGEYRRRVRVSTEKGFG